MAGYNHKRGYIKKQTLEKLLSSEPIRAYGIYDVVGYTLSDTRVKIRIDRDSNGRKRFGASTVWAEVDADGEIKIDDSQWEIQSLPLRKLIETYITELMCAVYINAHPIVSPSEEPKLAPKATTDPDPKIETVDETNITVVAFTVKSTDSGMVIEFVTDDGKKLVAKYGR